MKIQNPGGGSDRLVLYLPEEEPITEGGGASKDRNVIDDTIRCGHSSDKAKPQSGSCTELELEGSEVGGGSEDEYCDNDDIAGPPSPGEDETSSVPPAAEVRTSPNVDRSRSFTKIANRKQDFPESAAKYGCYLCPSLEEMSVNNLVYHIMFHNRRPMKCTTCSLYFANEADIKSLSTSCRQNDGEEDPSSTDSKAIPTICSSHTLQTVKYEPGHIPIWKCDKCPITFTTETERDLHETTVHDVHPDDNLPKKHGCSWCSKCYRNWTELKFHRVFQHSDMAPLCCPYCDQLFIMETREGIDVPDVPAMRSHVAKKHKQKCREGPVPPIPPISKLQAECLFCGEILSCPMTLYDHMKKAHGLSESDSHSCPVCHLKKQTTYQINGHLKRMHGVKTGEEVNGYFCEACGYECVSDHLRFEEHKFLEHGIPPPPEGRPVLKCSKEECDFQFLMKRKMERHKMKEHGVDRKHKCQTCGKGFLNGRHLRDHEEIHMNANVKPYQCEICRNSFSVKNYLYIHMRLSRSNRPFASTHKKKPSRSRKQAPSKAPESVGHVNAPNFEETLFKF